MQVVANTFAEMLFRYILTLLTLYMLSQLDSTKSVRSAELKVLHICLNDINAYLLKTDSKR